jgi:hypothetical protein
MVNEFNKRWGSVVVSCCFEKPVAEALGHFEKPEKWNVRRWKLLPSNISSLLRTCGTFCEYGTETSGSTVCEEMLL